MYADPDDLIQKPQLPPRKYEESEHGSSLVQDTEQVCVALLLDVILPCNSLLVVGYLNTA